jgi:hypothetical protein
VIGIGVSLFPSGEPLRVSVTADWLDFRNGALIGLLAITSKDDRVGLSGVVVAENGRIEIVSVSDFTVDWRYDTATDRWIDANAPRAEETDQEL